MSTHPEATRLNLEYYRKQAKALLKAVRAGDPSAVQRVRCEPALAALHHVQLTIAREQGFASWPRFKSFIVQSNLDFRGLVAAFVDASLDDSVRANEMLQQHPEIAGAGLYPALVLGDAASVERILQEMPSLVNAKGGPGNWEPLVFVCFSCFARRGSKRVGGHVETAKVLLRRGANPDAFCYPSESPDNPLSCLYGATGLNNNPELGLVLLEAGANPNDSESLYHSTEHPDLECVRLLLKHGAKTAGSNAVKHILDREDTTGLRLLLDTGADPNETNVRGETALHWAVFRGRSAKIVAMLLDGGAAIDAKRNDGRTAYALAIDSGQTEVAALLKARGADTSLSTLDAFLAACANADSAELDRLLAAPPDISVTPGNERLLPDLTISHRTAAVRALLATGVPVDSRGENGGTALHWACWKGYADLVKLLIDHGASLTIEDQQFHAPPPGWFNHGLHFCDERTGDYPEVARLLVAAGVKFPASDLPTGDAAVDAVIREQV